MDKPEIEVSDHVYLDDPDPKKVHWIVLRIMEPPKLNGRKFAHLQSGLTGMRKRGFPYERLTLHTKGTTDGIRTQEDPA